MAWRPVGSVSVGPTSDAVAVGSVELPPYGGIVVRVKQNGGPQPWPYGYGLLYVLNSRGRELGTIRVHGHTEGETYRLGAGLSSLVGGGVLYFTPRLWNLRWLDAMNTRWALEFSYDSPDMSLPQDRVQSPGFELPDGRRLPLVPVGSTGRLKF